MLMTSTVDTLEEHEAQIDNMRAVLAKGGICLKYILRSEVRIYKRKQESKKKRKKVFVFLGRERVFFLFFLDRYCLFLIVFLFLSFFFFISWSLSWSKACFLNVLISFINSHRNHARWQAVMALAWNFSVISMPLSKTSSARHLLRSIPTRRSWHQETQQAWHCGILTVETSVPQWCRRAGRGDSNISRYQPSRWELLLQDVNTEIQAAKSHSPK